MIKDTSEHYLSVEEERLLLKIARESLETVVAKGESDVTAYNLTPALMEKHGAFVTLRCNGDLRGCIGYTSNHVSLADAVRENAANAALHDLRFPRVTPGELKDITIEISALTPGDTHETPFKRVNHISEIVIGRDGLYIERPPQRGGLLLPQVAIEQGWDVPEFLTAVCRKAGYHHEAWKAPDAQLYRFSAQVFAEDRSDQTDQTDPTDQ